jgi:hypothetical protein
MVENTSVQVDHLHNKGTDRLLADIAAAKPDTEAERIELLEAACRIVGFRKGVTASRSSRISYAGVTEHEWTVFAWPESMGYINAAGTTIDETLAALSREYRKVSMKARIEAEAERAIKALDAAELATRDEATSVTDAAFRDAGDATSGTLPLVKLGQGDYAREINP